MIGMWIGIIVTVDWNGNDEVNEINYNVKNDESSLLTYILYHCLLIMNLFGIILDTVPTNMTCSTLSTVPDVLAK